MGLLHLQSVSFHFKALQNSWLHCTRSLLLTFSNARIRLCVVNTTIQCIEFKQYSFVAFQSVSSEYCAVHRAQWNYGLNLKVFSPSRFNILNILSLYSNVHMHWKLYSVYIIHSVEGPIDQKLSNDKHFGVPASTLILLTCVVCSVFRRQCASCVFCQCGVPYAVNSIWRVSLFYQYRVCLNCEVYFS